VTLDEIIKLIEDGGTVDTAQILPLLLELKGWRKDPFTKVKVVCDDTVACGHCDYEAACSQYRNLRPDRWDAKK
jgi:hypothetical protein